MFPGIYHWEKEYGEFGRVKRGREEGTRRKRAHEEEEEGRRKKSRKTCAMDEGKRERVEKSGRG